MPIPVPGNRCACLPLAGLMLAVCAPGLAVAQTPSSPESTESLETPIEEIVVVGSRIKRRDFVTPSPVTTLDRSGIDFTGQPTLEEALNRLPQIVPVSARAGNSGDGTATVDLRGLGAGRTLVLINGRRMAPTGTDNAVDLNNIPQALVERVEIITGGTSTVYGSDAIAGAINFVTRKDYTGLGIEAGVSVTERGDSESYGINISYGHDLANEKGNISVFANLVERSALLAGEREFTSVPLRDDWEGNIIEDGSWSTPSGVIRRPLADLGDGPVYTTFDPDGTPREFDPSDDLYNYSTTNLLQTPLDRLAVGLFSHYDLSEQLEAYVEASFVTNEPSMQGAPLPAWKEIEVNIDNPLLTPETRQLFADQFVCDPNLACLSFDKRFSELGPRQIEIEQDYARILAGLRGGFGRGWEFDGWLIYTDGTSSELVYNLASLPRYLQGLMVDPVNGECFDPTGGCVPLDVFGPNRLSDPGADFIRLAPAQSTTSQSQALASFYVTGSPTETWAGPLDIAVGADWRRDKIDFRPDDVLFTGDVLGWPPISPVEGTDEVTEIYAESIIPLATDRSWADYLGLEIGARYSDYEHAGGVWTYKIGTEWQPADSVRFRIMHQRSTRAPNSADLFEAQYADLFWFVWDDPVEDPCSASADPEDNNVVEKCLLQGLPAEQVGVFEATPRYPVEFLFGGNTDLVPELGDTLTAGVILSPSALANWTMSIDYFALEVTDTIGDVDPFSICFDSLNPSNVFCENIQRDATGNIANIDERTGNRGLLKTTGIDTQIQYTSDVPENLSLGDHTAFLSVNLLWSYLLTHQEQENPVTEILDCAGYFGWPCNAHAAALPENKVMINVDYSSGPLQTHLSWRWIDSTKNAAPMKSYIYGYPDPDLAIPVVPSQHYVDLGFSYKISEGFSARFGINNLFDNDPPLTDSGPNTDPGLYDVFGRSYFLALSSHF